MIGRKVVGMRRRPREFSPDLTRHFKDGGSVLILSSDFYRVQTYDKGKVNELYYSRITSSERDWLKIFGERHGVNGDALPAAHHGSRILLPFSATTVVIALSRLSPGDRAAFMRIVSPTEELSRMTKLLNFCMKL